MNLKELADRFHSKNLLTIYRSLGRTNLVIRLKIKAMKYKIEAPFELNRIEIPGSQMEYIDVGKRLIVLF
jgi:hypothetical protein